MQKLANGVWASICQELDRYPASSTCFAIAGGTLLVAAGGGVVNLLIAEVMAVTGLAVLGVFYGGLGVWHRIADVPRKATVGLAGGNDLEYCGMRRDGVS